MSILQAAAKEIRTLLVEADPLNAQTFAKVLYIARRAEEIACAEGRPDEIAVKTKALEALEGKAPGTHAAIREDLFGGAPSLRAKQIQLEKDHAAVRNAAAALKEQKDDFQQETRALSAGGPRATLQLASYNTPTSGVVEGEIETETETPDGTPEDEEYTPLDPETKAKRFAQFSKAFDQLPRTYEGELEAENEAHKENAKLV